MPGFTPYYNLAYFNYADDRSSGYNVDLEVDRFSTIDQQLYGIYSVFGNGSINGWTVFDNGYTIENGISIGISSGMGIIKSLASQTIVPVLLNSLPANSTFYVFASVYGNTNYNRTVIFATSTATSIGAGAIRLAQVTTGNNSVSVIDNTNRDFIPFQATINDIVNSQSFRTVDTKIDLTLDVKNQLSGARLADIDTQLITSGILSSQNIPTISHTNLEDIGSIPHAGLDAFTNTITGNNQQLLGEITSVNQMIQTMYMKYLHSDVDQYMLNVLYMIPGISPNSFIDYVYTTAQVDTVTHCIVGSRTTSQPVYFYTANFSLTSPPVKCILQSNNNKNGEIIFGVNTNDSVNFNDYQVLNQNAINVINNPTSNLKVGISLSGNSYPSSSSSSEEVYEDYSTPIEQNAVMINFTNAGSTDTFNFRIKFYNDILLTNLAFTADSSTNTHGFSYNDLTFPVGGIVINNGSTDLIFYDPTAQPLVVCNKIYYLTIEYKNGSGYHLISNTNTFLKQCNPSFVDFFFFKYQNKSNVSKTVQFRIQFYLDSERTNLIYTAYSLNSQIGWLVNSVNNFPSTGQTIASGNSIDVTFYPNLSIFNKGQPYYLVIDVWNGSSFNQISAEYTFETYTSNTSPSQYYHYSVVSNFSIMFELADNSIVYLNL